MSGEILRWVGAALLGALSLIIIVGNPLAARAEVRAGRGYSWIPIIGGMLGASAIMLAPLGTLRQRLYVAWIPFVLDLTIPMVIWALVQTSRKDGFASSRSREQGGAAPDNEETP